MTHGVEHINQCRLTNSLPNDCKRIAMRPLRRRFPQHLVLGERQQTGVLLARVC